MLLLFMKICTIISFLTDHEVASTSAVSCYGSARVQHPVHPHSTLEKPLPIDEGYR